MVRRERFKLTEPNADYKCPHCGQEFAHTSPEFQWTVSFHRLLHVDDSQERWKLMDDWIAEQKEDRHDPATRCRAQAR